MRIHDRVGIRLRDRAGGGYGWRLILVAHRRSQAAGLGKQAHRLTNATSQTCRRESQCSLHLDNNNNGCRDAGKIDNFDASKFVGSALLDASRQGRGGGGRCGRALDALTRIQGALPNGSVLSARMRMVLFPTRNGGAPPCRATNPVGPRTRPICSSIA